MSTSKKMTFSWLLLVIAGFAALQVVTKPAITKLKPGRERDDVLLTSDVLPPSIGKWQKSCFQPPDEANTLSADQYWITHAWCFGNGEHLSTVAFDQLGLHEWHELTVCYRAKGWEILNRSVEVDTDAQNPWSCAVAFMSNPQGEHGLLVFSVFRGDGQPMTPPESEFDQNQTNPAQGKDGFWSRLQHRTQSQVASRIRPGLENRALQCQVFLVSQRSPDNQLVLETKQLHLASRLRFRDAWLAHATVTQTK